MTTTLIYTGIGCILAAILGGGLKAFNMELPVVTSLKRQALLGAFGAILIVGGVLSDPAVTLPGLNPVFGWGKAKITDNQPILVGIYPSDAFGIAQTSALHKVGELFPTNVRVVDLQLPLDTMKHGNIDVILKRLADLLRTQNVLAVIGPSVTESVLPVLDTVHAAAPGVPTFLLSAASADTYAGRARRQPIFRLSAGIDARAEEFSNFVTQARENGTRVHFLVEKSSNPMGGASYGEQLLSRVAGEIGDEAWRKFLRQNDVKTTRYTPGNVAEAFAALEQAVATDQVIVLFGLGGDLKKIVEHFYAVREGKQAPVARIVGWMNAWALSGLAAEGAYHWPLIFEVTDAYFSSDGHVLTEAAREFTSAFPLGPQSRDEIYAFDSGYAAMLAYLRTADKFGKLKDGNHYLLDSRFRRPLLAELEKSEFPLVSGRVQLSKRGNARESLVYTRYDPYKRRWIEADISGIFRQQH